MERQSMVLTVRHQLIAAVASAQRIGARQVLEAMCEMETFTVYPKWFNEASTCDADTPRSSERLPPVFVPHFTRRLNFGTLERLHDNRSLSFKFIAWKPQLIFESSTIHAPHHSLLQVFP